MADEPDSDDEREMGVDLGEFDDVLDDLSYPVSADELAEEYGDYELDLEGGAETVGEILGPLDDDFEDPGEVRQGIYNMVGREAVGRDRYSDRGTSVPEGQEDESF